MICFVKFYDLFNGIKQRMWWELGRVIALSLHDEKESSQFELVCGGMVVRHLKVIASHMDSLSMLVSLGPVGSRILSKSGWGVVYYMIALLPTATAREGKVFRGVCQSFCSQLASWLLGHCSSLLWPRILGYGVFSTHPTGMLIKIYLFSINRRRHVQMYVHVRELIWKPGTWVTLNKPVPTCPENEHQRESIPVWYFTQSLFFTLQNLLLRKVDFGKQTRLGKAANFEQNFEHHTLGFA